MLYCSENQSLDCKENVILKYIKTIVLPVNLSLSLLAHLPQDKMAAISPTTFSSECWWMKVLYFDLNFTEFCSQWSSWQQNSIGSDNGLASNRPEAIIWTNADQIHWRTYAALWGDELSNTDLPYQKQMVTLRFLSDLVLYSLFNWNSLSVKVHG